MKPPKLIQAGRSPAPPAGEYQLADRYRASEGTVQLTGVQALVRLPFEQLRLDRVNGLNTAAMVSGYPGSPLGGFDLELQRALKTVTDLPIVHQPAVNEELGATTIMGSQLAAGRPDARYDGVVGLWYGKAPGLDRAGDALRHGVFAGASRYGGAVVLVGDDPNCKSSTMPSSSDATLVDLHMPILYPGTIAECIELGLHAVAISRASGLWASMKIVTPIADGAGTVDLPALHTAPILPTVEVDGREWRCEPSAKFLGPRMLEVEREFREIRTPLAVEYGIVNGLNRVTVDPPDAWIGLVATGFTYYELLEALRRLGLATDADIANAGIRLLHLRMPVPFDTALIRQFARGLDEIVVVEEKNATLEWLIKDALYGGPHQPVVLGKHDEQGATLMKSWGQLDADAIKPGLRRRLEPRLTDRLAPEPPADRDRVLEPLSLNRTPFFCSGCPHNWGTKVPEGTLVGAGTGCHGMTLLMDPSRVGETIGITAMGNEGANWVGMAPFVDTDHIVQNYGDGTYFHSAQVALQYCIAAGVNMTFKILYNSTVAMTGGQDAPDSIGVPRLCAVLLAQGVRRVVVTADDPQRYRGHGGANMTLPEGVEVRDRTELVATQRELAAVEGVTVIIHDQRCAAELRRDRKRGLAPQPTTRVVINHRICEGCGDCGDVSNCLSVQPVETPLGRKTTIDQNSCNVDLSCLHGDCPAFMTVTVDESSAKPGQAPTAIAAPTSPEPDVPAGIDRLELRLAGIGGTGVVTVAQILSTAAMLDGWTVHGLDQTGLSQKAGPVISDVILTRHDAHTSNLVGTGLADLLIAFDGLVAASDSTIAAADPSRTKALVATAITPTGKMISSPGTPYPSATVDQRLRESCQRVLELDPAHLSLALTGSASGANLLQLGVAVQMGWLPVSPAAVATAIELNNVAVASNLAAFDWGRAWVGDRDTVEQAAATATTPATQMFSARLYGSDRRLPDPVHQLAGDLVDYQNTAYADRFLDVIQRVAATEQRVRPGTHDLTLAAARSLHKLMAYKDEYEVARLMLLPEAAATIDEISGTGSSRGRGSGAHWLLHPPILAALGRTDKIRFGPSSRPVFSTLQKGKRVRGKWYDPFGRTQLRRLERELPDEFIQAITTVCADLATESDAASDEVYAAAIEIAALPDMVRGFESLKLTRIADYRAALTQLMTRFGVTLNGG